VKFLRNFLDKQEENLKGTKFFYLFEAIDSFLFTTGTKTKRASHIRDFLDLKRTMVIVVLALIPAVFMALYNTGYQANLAIQKLADFQPHTWQQSLLATLGIAFDAGNFFANIIHGALYFFPVYIVTLMVGGFWEVLFATIRKHPIAEGFLVTSLLFPLIVPPNIPYWQVAFGVSFGVVIGKEVFGGVGMNVFNPALVGRAFLFFAYPAQISGDKVWVAIDGVSQATPLAQLADPLMKLSSSWYDAFIGLIPGSMGETSTLACLIGAVILIVTGIGSWRIMLSIIIGMVTFSLFLNFAGSNTNPMFAISPVWHLVVGGFAFGTVFMATDPVSSAFTNGGKWIYGLLIGALVVLIRVLNPAFPEGMMLAILFGNAFAPIFDKIFVNRNIKRRQLRNAN